MKKLIIKKLVSNKKLIINIAWGAVSIFVFCLIGHLIGKLSHASINDLQLITGWSTLIFIIIFGCLSTFWVRNRNIFLRYFVMLGWCLIAYDYAGYLFNNSDLSGPAALFGKFSPSVTSIMFNIATFCSMGVVALLSYELHRLYKFWKLYKNKK